MVDTKSKKSVDENALQKLKKITKGRHHFGLNIVELDESKNYVVFDFGEEYDDVNIDVALTILNKKPLTLTGQEELLDPLIISASKDPTVKNKIFVYKISDLFQDKNSNPSYLVYNNRFRESAILQSFIHSGRRDIITEIRKLMNDYISSIADNHSMTEQKINLIREHIFTFMIGHLFGYSDNDIMGFMFKWGNGWWTKKSGVKYRRTDIQKSKENMLIIKDAAMEVLKNMKKTTFFKTYKQKLKSVEIPLHKFTS